MVICDLARRTHRLGITVYEQQQFCVPENILMKIDTGPNIHGFPGNTPKKMHGGNTGEVKAASEFCFLTAKLYLKQTSLRSDTHSPSRNSAKSLCSYWDTQAA